MFSALIRLKRSQKSRYSTKILVLNLDLGFKNIHECKQYISYDFTVEGLFYTSKRITCSAVHYHQASRFLNMTNIFLFTFLCFV